MKNLNLISFVGVDEQTVLTELDKISNSFVTGVAVEWSVLYSDSKSVTKHTRYPSYNFCKGFLERGAKTLYTMCSLHLCGSVIDRYLKQEQDVMDLCAPATRIQLNLNIHNYPDYDKLTDDILAVANKHKHHLILQQNKTKEKFMEVFLKKAPIISLLHDGSGGFGREITSVVSPDPKHKTGYAGGINPDNVKKIVELIDANNPNNLPYYIDMESGIRENNIFSVEKCIKVIDNLKL